MLPYIFTPKPFFNQGHIIILLIVINCFLLFFYYFNTLILIPKLLFKRKWILYLLSIVACLVIFIYVPKEVSFQINKIAFKENTYTDTLAIKERMEEQDSIKAKMKRNIDSLFEKRKGANNSKHFNKTREAFRYFPGSFVVFLLIIFIGICIKVFEQWLEAEQRNEKIKTEKLQTELSFLKTQVNPHFFFNTLNNIYSLAIVNSEKTAPAVMKLSSIMRYILAESQMDKVPLEKEVEFIKNFIDLQLVRLTDKVQVEFKVDGNINQQQIAPLLFIPFIENAFKYGVSTKETSDINIQLTAHENKVLFNVKNKIVLSNNLLNDTTGIGINNVKRRLALCYPNKHVLQVIATENLFTVNLEIELQ